MPQHQDRMSDYVFSPNKSISTDEKNRSKRKKNDHYEQDQKLLASDEFSANKPATTTATTLSGEKRTPSNKITARHKQVLAASAKLGGGQSISQFSAQTLRKAFKLSSSRRKNDHNHQQRHQSVAPTRGSHGNLSSSLASASPSAASVSVAASIPDDIFSPERPLFSSSSSSSIPKLSPSSAHGRSARCYCCCCTGQCSSSEWQRFNASQQQQHRTVTAGPGSANGGRPSYSSGGFGLAARQDSTKHRWQKATRKPIPVPPPIVPLHKQLACGLNQNSITTGHDAHPAPPKTPVTFRLDYGRAGVKLCDRVCPDANKVDDDNLNRDHNPSARDPVLFSSTVASSASNVSPIGCCSNQTTDRGDAKTTTDDYEHNWIQLSCQQPHPDQGAVQTSSTPTSVNPDQSSSSTNFPAAAAAAADCCPLENDDFSELNPLSAADVTRIYPAAKLLPPLSAAVCDSGRLSSNRDRDGSGRTWIKKNVPQAMGATDEARQQRCVAKDNISSHRHVTVEAADVRLSFFEGKEKHAEINSCSDDKCSDRSAPVVDIKFQIPEKSSASSPRATPTLTAAGATPILAKSEHQHGQSTSLSAIYDLPESGGAREFVRVEISEGKRKVTASRLPLRPARRPSMPPPPPPPPPAAPLLLSPRQQQPVPPQQQRQRKGSLTVGRNAAGQEKTNSGCVVANFSAGRAPISPSLNDDGARCCLTANRIVAHNSQSKDPTETVCEKSKHISLQTSFGQAQKESAARDNNSKRQSDSVVAATATAKPDHHYDDEGEFTSANQLKQLPASKLVANRIATIISGSRSSNDSRHLRCDERSDLAGANAAGQNPQCNESSGRKPNEVTISGTRVSKLSKPRGK